MPDSAHLATVFKLLSGPQRGAEIPLDDGEYLIGSDEDCDIVLLDDSVAGHHVLLNKQGEKLQLTARDQAVLVGAYELPQGESTDIPTGTVFGLGTTYIALGLPGVDWLSLPLPGRPAPHEATGANPPTFAPPPSAHAPASRFERHRKFWIITAGMVVILTFVLALFRHDLSIWLSTGQKAAVLSDHTLEHAKKILADLGMTEIYISENHRGDIVLRGDTDTKVARERLLDALKQAGIPVISYVRAIDVLRRALRKSLNRLGSGQLTFDYLGQGAVRLHGLLNEDIAREELLIMLQQDVPMISRIDDAQVRTLADSVADLRERLRTDGLASLITVVAEAGAIVTSGELDAEQVLLWQKIKDAFTAATQGTPELISYVKMRNGDALTEAKGAVAPTPRPEARVAPMPHTHAALQLSVRGIVIGTGKRPYALLSNGLRVSQGDALDENHVIDAIELDRVVVRNGAQTYVYYIGEGS